MDHDIKEKSQLDIYICTYSGEKYRGKCIITSCPANISHLEDRPSGCIYTFLNKFELSKFEIAYAFNTTADEVEKKILKSEAKIKKIMIINKVLEDVRNKLNSSVSCCKICGIIKDAKSICLNKIKCEQRVLILTQLYERYPFNLNNLNIKPEEFWFMIINRQTYNKKIEEEKLKLFSLFSIKKSFRLKVLRSLPPILAQYSRLNINNSSLPLPPTLSAIPAISPEKEDQDGKIKGGNKSCSYKGSQQGCKQGSGQNSHDSKNGSKRKINKKFKRRSKH